jgi:hypothetical protein
MTSQSKKRDTLNMSEDIDWEDDEENDEGEDDGENDEARFTHKAKYFECDRALFLANIEAIFAANPTWAKPWIVFSESLGSLEIGTHQDCAEEVFRLVSKLLGTEGNWVPYEI